MSVKTKRVILALFLSVFLILSTAILAHAYSSILAFGDSLSDNGIYGQYTGPLSNTNDQYTGAICNTDSRDSYGFQRYSNGPVWVEYLAGPSHLNVPLLDLAYGGATTGWDNPAAYQATLNPVFLSATGLQWQVWAYGQRFGNINSIAPTTLVTLWAGGNDMFNSRPADTAADNIELAIQNLYAIGGRSFLIPNLPYTDLDPYEYFKQPFDAKLASDLAALKATYPGIDIYALDLNGFVPTGINHYDGTWMGHYMPSDDVPDMGPGTYASWDGVHPTTEVHAQIAAYAAVATEVPEPATMLLLGSGLLGLWGFRKKFKK
jgi:phospholipase/lecithinase/hemolysin